MIKMPRPSHRGTEAETRRPERAPTTIPVAPMRSRSWSTGTLRSAGGSSAGPVLIAVRVRLIGNANARELSLRFRRAASSGVTSDGPRSPQTVVDPVESEELLVGALFDHLAGVHDENGIGTGGLVETMGDHQR